MRGSGIAGCCCHLSSARTQSPPTKCCCFYSPGPVMGVGASLWVPDVYEPGFAFNVRDGVARYQDSPLQRWGRPADAVQSPLDWQIIWTAPASTCQESSRWQAQHVSHGCPKAAGMVAAGRDHAKLSSCPGSRTPCALQMSPSPWPAGHVLPLSTACISSPGSPLQASVCYVHSRCITTASMCMCSRH